MRLGTVLAALSLALAPLVATYPAQADDDLPVVVQPGGTGTETVITEPGDDGSATGGASTGTSASASRCIVRHDPTGMVAEVFDGTWPDPADVEAGRVWWFGIDCPNSVTRAVWLLVGVGADPGTVTPPVAAEIARRFMPVPAPDVRTNPEQRAVVGIPTWLWLDSGSWSTQSSTLMLGGTSVTVVAKPIRVVWQTGEGTVTCDGPGAAYDPTATVGAQHTDCAWTYRQSSRTEPAGAYAASATSYWRIRWSATGPAGTTSGALADLPRQTDFTIRVAEVHALVTT
jgi:hypothetical protein